VPKLPVLSGAKLINILKKIGFQVIRHKGSHVSLQKGIYKTVVPLHDELAKGTLLGILNQCGLSKDDLIDPLKKIKD
jgi:predicted RNA binding protein YcfA (HicA-like mRNA interferase family)